VIKDVAVKLQKGAKPPKPVSFSMGDILNVQSFALKLQAGADPISKFLHDQLSPAVQKLVGKLSYAGNEAARRYLNGEIDRAAAVEYLQRWAMSPKDRAEQRTRFFDEYRSYVINYNFGQDLVREYVEKRGGTVDRPQDRWKVFGDLLSSPRLPSGLR